MAIYPGAVFKPTGFGGKTKRNRQGRGILHVAVSGARSLPPWNANTWHFYVAKDGYCEQYIDTDYRAATSGAANDDAIGIETAGGLGSSAQINAEPWTPAQVDRLADIMAWESKQPGGAPLDLLPDSKPGRRGWGPHRLGIEHSRGVGAVPGWLVPGGERWSSARGKECPGDTKVRQIGSELIPLARRKAGGAPTAPEDDMPSAKEVVDELFNREIHFRYRDDSDPRGYGESHVPFIDAFVDVYTQLLWGHGRNLNWGPGLALQLRALAAAAPTGGVDVDALAAKLGAALQDKTDPAEALRKVLREGVDS